MVAWYIPQGPVARPHRHPRAACVKEFPHRGGAAGPLQVLLDGRAAAIRNRNSIHGPLYPVSIPGLYEYRSCRANQVIVSSHN